MREDIDNFIFKYDSDVHAEDSVYSESGYSYSLIKKMLSDFGGSAIK